MEEEPITRGLKEKLLKDIRHDVKEEGGERIALMEAPTILNPFTRNAIQKNSRLTRGVKGLDEIPPEGGKPLASRMQSSASQLIQSKALRKSSLKTAAGDDRL